MEVGSDSYILYEFCTLSTTAGPVMATVSRSKKRTQRSNAGSQTTRQTDKTSNFTSSAREQTSKWLSLKWRFRDDNAKNYINRGACMQTKAKAKARFYAHMAQAKTISCGYACYCCCIYHLLPYCIYLFRYFFTVISTSFYIFTPWLHMSRAGLRNRFCLSFSSQN